MSRTRIDDRLVGAVVRLPCADRTWGPWVRVVGVLERHDGVRVTFCCSGAPPRAVLLGYDVAGWGALASAEVPAWDVGHG